MATSLWAVNLVTACGSSGTGSDGAGSGGVGYGTGGSAGGFPFGGASGAGGSIVGGTGVYAGATGFVVGQVLPSGQQLDTFRLRGP